MAESWFASLKVERTYYRAEARTASFRRIAWHNRVRLLPAGG